MGTHETESQEDRMLYSAVMDLVRQLRDDAAYCRLSEQAFILSGSTEARRVARAWEIINDVASRWSVDAQTLKDTAAGMCGALRGISNRDQARDAMMREFTEERRAAL